MKISTNNPATNFAKKALKALTMIAMVLCAVSLAACSDDDDDEGGASKNPNHPGTNKVLALGQVYTLLGGGQEYYGNEYNDDATTFDVYLVSDGLQIELEMHQANGSETLAAGTYTVKKGDYSKGFISDAYVDRYGHGLEEIYVDIADGTTVTISVSGETYTIEIDGKLADGTDIVGNYTGKLDWFTYTPE
ncbi:MAG: hypothetical protein LIO85_01565 [Rikenellaceae bacterium]|nr:hypothetical protein [Rikenellaceae bacterium]